MEEPTLASLPVGSSAVIAEIRTDRREAAHLAELGIIAGTEVTCKLRGAGGSPIAFSVHGVTLALRAETCEQITITAQSRPVTYLLAGNPNVGKSTVFNALTGLHQHTGNWCGKTVAGAEGIMQPNGARIRLIDTPGTYSVRSSTAEEAVTGEIIRQTPHDCIICVIDMTCPMRGIALLLELLEQDSRVLLCCNLMDEAEKKRISADFDKLSQLLGIPVIGISARKKAAVRTVAHAAETASRNKQPRREPVPRSQLFAEAESLVRQTFTIPPQPHRRTDRADRLLTGRLLRIPLMLLLLLVTFWITMVGANYPSALLAAGFSALCKLLLNGAASAGIPAWLSGALIGGMLRGTGWVISVMLPPMMIFFPLFTLLEDIGILPRIAFNTDRCCACCKACGKQALTMTMGFGCNAVGVTECRIIESRRERLIAILTNAFVPCNGRFPSLLAIVTIFFAGTGAGASFRAACIMTLLILLSIAVTFAVSWLLGRTLLRGAPSSFVLELPPYRRPQPAVILVRSICDRTVFVLGRAAAVAAPMSLLIWLLANLCIGNVSILQHLSAVMQPFGAVIGLDGVLLLAFMLGLPANEIILPVAVTAYLGTASLTDYGSLSALHSMLTANGWTTTTAACFLVFTLFHAPCATTLLTIYKETGSRRWTALAWFLPTAAGILLCALIAFAAA
ncbi:MAG: fused ferrous iron transport protein A/B [Oscillospiraceae bacterium]|nr:fused ferrous iron transport protein A/B [Oscillospiraceae bacterium]